MRTITDGELGIQVWLANAEPFSQRGTQQNLALAEAAVVDSRPRYFAVGCGSGFRVDLDTTVAASTATSPLVMKMLSRDRQYSTPVTPGKRSTALTRIGQRGRFSGSLVTRDPCGYLSGALRVEQAGDLR